MEFKIEKNKNLNEQFYSKDEMDIAYDFAKKLYKEFSTIIKAVVIFGSTARGTNSNGDVDVLIIVDDLKIVLNPEIVEAYRIITEKTVLSISSRIHVTTLKFTNFWDYARAGDPIAVNILRDGVAIIDTGFFEPLQLLLRQGRIRPSEEAIYTYYSRAPKSLFSSRTRLLSATMDLYWAVIDSAHAALMKLGEIPPSPEHVSGLIQKRMVDEHLVSSRYVEIMSGFYKLSKAIAKREVKLISGKEYEEYYKLADEFVSEMKKIIEEKVMYQKKR